MLPPKFKHLNSGRLKNMLELVDVLTQEQASAVLLKQRVRKFFPGDTSDGGQFSGGWFEGQVHKIDKGLVDHSTGQPYGGLLFLIK